MMNERIKELIAEATTTEYGVDNGFDRVTFDKEKFAELIVRECANYALEKGKASPDTDFRTGSLIISEFLLAHFGVEE